MTREDSLLNTLNRIAEECDEDEYNIMINLLCDKYGTEYIAELLMS